MWLKVITANAVFILPMARIIIFEISSSAFTWLKKKGGGDYH